MAQAEIIHFQASSRPLLPLVAVVIVPVFLQEIRTPAIEGIARPANPPTPVVDIVVRPGAQPRLRLPVPERIARPAEPPTFIAPFGAIGALAAAPPMPPLKPPPPTSILDLLRPQAQAIVPIDPAGIAAAAAIGQLILPRPEHRPPVSFLLTANTLATVPVPPTAGIPGDNVIMSVFPYHEISRPIAATFPWKIAIQATGMDDEDNGGSDITNPDTQIVGTTRNVLKINKRGTFIQLRLVYDDGLGSITDPVVQAFGRHNSDDQWQRLKNLSDSVDVTLTTAAIDVTDGTNKYTDPASAAQTIDLDATDEVIVRVKTALAGTGDATTAFLEAKVIGGVRTF